MMQEQDTPKCVVPSTLDGWACLHEFYTVDWASWFDTDALERSDIIEASQSFLTQIAKPSKGHSGFFSMLGHKSDLMFLHFRETFDELNEIELKLRRQSIFSYLIPTTSYVSIVELGMYAMTQKIFEELLEKGLKVDSEEWNQAWKERIQDQHNRMKGRIFTEIPSDRYVCFYPMNKKREDQNNWYTVDYQDRSQMMLEHGMVGRKYAGRVQQIISGSIGFDDWEWGVDLFAQDPKVFKDLIYEMRFDRASALYAEFGPFYTGLQFKPEQIKDFLQGTLPK